MSYDKLFPDEFMKKMDQVLAEADESQERGLRLVRNPMELGGVAVQLTLVDEHDIPVYFGEQPDLPPSFPVRLPKIPPPVYRRFN